MKIDTDLRAAIRSAYLNQKRSRDDWAARQAAGKEAIAKLLKSKPALAKALQKAVADRLRAYASARDAEAIINAAGLDHDMDRITDEQKFVKAGGVFTFTESPKWTFDQLMAQLAAATPKQGAALLEKCGINWQ